MRRSCFVNRSCIRKARTAARRSLIEKKQSRPRRGGLGWDATVSEPTASGWYATHPICVLWTSQG